MARGRQGRRQDGAEPWPDGGATTSHEAELWAMANALRGSMDAVEYKHVVLGLIFLKYNSDAFEERHAAVLAEWGAEAAEDRDEYTAENIFWGSPEVRWNRLKAQAWQPDVGRAVDDVMAVIELDNPVLESVQPKDYARPAFDKQRLGQLIDMIGNIGVGDAEACSRDAPGRCVPAPGVGFSRHDAAVAAAPQVMVRPDRRSRRRSPDAGHAADAAIASMPRDGAAFLQTARGA